MKKRITALILAVLMVCTLLPVSAFAAGSSFSNATSISTGTSYTDRISTSSEQDYYKFSISSAGYVTFSFKHDYVDDTSDCWIMYLYDSACEEMTYWYYAGNTAATKTSTKIGLPAGTYYLKVTREWHYSDVPYSLTVNYTASSAWETEFNDTFATSDSISTNKAINGSLMKNLDNDFYKFTISSAGYVTFSFKHDYVDDTSDCWKMYLYDSDCEEMIYWYYAGNTAATKTSAKIGLPAGTYYLKVTREWHYSDVPYSLTVNYTASSAWETEFNDTFATSDYISTNSAINGSLMKSTDSDYYRFSLSKTDYVTFSFRHSIVSNNGSWKYWVVYLYNGDCEEVGNWGFTGDSSATLSTAKLKLKPGTYYLKVTNYDYSDVPYTLTVKVGTSISAPTVKLSNVASSGKIKLTWGNVKGASKYEVWRSTSENGTYSKLGTTSKTSYTNSSAKAGNTYYYKVKAVADDGTKSAYSSVKHITCDCARPVVKLSNVASSGKIKLSWEAVDGAVKYEVYRATSKDGKYSKLGTTTNTYYTNTGATAGKTYYYKVKAICSSSAGNSAYSAVKSRTCDLARPTVKITTSNGDPKLSWASISGASKYEIYRATSKSGTYTKMYTTTKTSYTNTSAKAGKTYYYKVKAICSASSYGNSAYSTVVSIKAK